MVTCYLLKVATRHFRMDKVALVDMVDIVDMWTTWPWSTAKIKFKCRKKQDQVGPESNVIIYDCP